MLGLVFAAVVSAQQPAMLYGGSQPDQARAVVEAVDEGYCLAGWTRSYGPRPGSNALVVKVDRQGVPLWAFMSVGQDDEEACSMTRTQDQCYVVAGWTASHGIGIPNRNVFVTKLDVNGLAVWSWVYGGEMNDVAQSVVETFDGGYAVAGWTESYGPRPHPNVLVLKLDQGGAPEWLKAYWCVPEHLDDEGYAIVQTQDSGFAVVGRTKIRGPLFFSPFVLKLDSRGAVQWVNVGGGETGSDEGYGAGLARTGGVLVSGSTTSFGTNPGTAADIFVAEFALDGNPNWSQTIGWADGDEMALGDRSVIGTSDGGVAVCGPTSSVGPGAPYPNFLMVKLDQRSQVEWARSHPSDYHPGMMSDVPYGIAQTAAGGYAVVGWSNSFDLLGGDDCHFVTLDGSGNRRVCVEPQTPIQDLMLWARWEMGEEVGEPTLEVMPMEPVEILLAGICVDTTGVGEGRRETYEGRSTEFQLRTSNLGRVELCLIQRAAVEVSVFASDGRELCCLARAEFDAGRHELALPDAPAGVYVVRARALGRATAAKVVRY